MFIGRETELQFLEDRYQDGRGQLVVLYGRRRIGKTETLRKFCEDKPHLFYACDQSTDRIQLRRFSKQMLARDIPSCRYVKAFEDWESAFEAMADLPSDGKRKLIVIDEFPYMCRGNPAIPSVLQNLWDAKLKDADIMLVLCGSSMSFVEKEILAEKNPLYGRATGIYKMKEMGFYDAIRFFPGWSSRDQVAAYAILGGIPHYLKQFSPKLSLAENIKKRILTPGIALYGEVEFLLHQELREPSVYTAIIEAVALGCTKLNEISRKSCIDDTSKTSVYLRNLMELGIVEREFSVDTQLKEKVSPGRGLYRLTDSFFRFWYTFGYANLSELEDGNLEQIWEAEIEPQLHEFVSHAFEDVCIQFVKRLQRRKELPFYYSKIGRWFGKTTIRDKAAANGLRTAESEIDLLAFDRKATAYLVGECKYRHRPFSYSEWLNTQAKLSNLKEHAVFYYALFSESGFEPDLVKEAEGNPKLRLFDLDEIVRGEGSGGRERGSEE